MTAIYDTDAARAEFRSIMAVSVEKGLFKAREPEPAFLEAAISYAIPRFMTVTGTDFSKRKVQDFISVIVPALLEERETTLRLIRECNN